MVFRTRRRIVALAFALLSVHATAWGAPILSNVQFGQKDWFGPSGNLVAQDSLWGYLRFDYQPDPDETFFLNVSAALSGDPAQWVIQNIPLFPSLTASDLGLEFDLGELGITPGTDVSSLDVILSVDLEFQSAPPVGLPSTFGVENLVRFAWNDIGAPGATEPFDDPGSPKGNKNTAEPETTPKERDIKALQEEALRCFPGSMARSLDWLNREHKLGANKSIEDIYKELRDKVKDAPGTTVVDRATAQIRLKDEYADATFGKIVTKVYDPLGFVNKIPGVQERGPDVETLIEWLTREIDTEDVELAYFWNKGTNGATTDGAHIVTLVGVYTTKDGKIKVRYRDDDHQGNDAKGDTEVKEAELYLKDDVYRFGADQNLVWYGAAESVPEPTTVTLTGLGLTVLALRRRLVRHGRRRPGRGADPLEASRLRP